MEGNGFVGLASKSGIGEEYLKKIASETGFIRRERKISAMDILHAICVASLSSFVSNNDAAAKMYAECGISLSRQSIWKKMGVPGTAFFEKVLGALVGNKSAAGKKLALKGKFLRIIVQDSTIIKLPPHLFDLFSGVSNGLAKACNARIQAAYDLVSGEFLKFSLDPYSKNDLKAAPELELSPGDLVLRDRGYLTAAEIRRHAENGAHCIYRHKHAFGLLDVSTGEPLDLLGLLRRQGHADMEVGLKTADGMAVRLVAAPTGEEVANLRRKKAKEEKKAAPSKEYLAMLSWTIFLTTVDKGTASFDELLSLYGLRWRIEVIFKSWKSNMSFDKVHRVAQCQAYILFYARMIHIVLTFSMFNRCSGIVSEEYGKELSILKFTRYLVENPSLCAKLCEEMAVRPGEGIEAVARYCTYETRNRESYAQIMNKLDAFYA